MKKILLRLRTFLRSRASRAAFTLIEMLIVIGISTLVSAAAILYSNVGQNEVSLTVETAKVAQLILQARELALDTYSGTSGACAYGVHFDITDQTYSLFAYTPGTSRCPSAETVESTTIISSGVMGSYASSSWQMPVAKGVVIVSPGNLPTACSVGHTGSPVVGDILFYPPAPATLISPANGNGKFSSPTPSSIVCLETSDGKNTAVIAVNPEGQVSF
jgi:prepilin-type N-terminal cleavage/methylation domain-containing protein